MILRPVAETDLYVALVNNPECGVVPEDISGVLMEIKGVKESKPWYWIVQFCEKETSTDYFTEYTSVEGYVDYIDWDRKSSVQVYPRCPTVDAVLDHVMLVDRVRELAYFSALYRGATVSIGSLLRSVGVDESTCVVVLEQGSEKKVLINGLGADDATSVLWPSNDLGEPGRLSIPNFIAQDNMYIYTLQRKSFISASFMINSYYRDIQNYVAGRYAVSVLSLTIDTESLAYKTKLDAEKLPLYRQI